jgi:hypothetical protein
MPKISQLRCNPPKCRHQLQSLRDDIRCTHKRVLSYGKNGKSHASADFYLTNHDDKEFNNGAILTASSMIKHVMFSASAALYYGCKLAVPICTTLKEMGHPQLERTMIITNNITAQGLTMGTMTPKVSELMDQCFHWLKCHIAQHQFLYFWRHGIDNCAHYTSKHHPAKNRQAVCPFYIYDTLPRKCIIFLCPF